MAVRQARCKIASGAAAAAGAVAGPRAAGPVGPVAVVIAAAAADAAAAVVGLRQFAPVAPRVRGLVLERLVLAGAARLHLVALRKTNAAARPDAGLADLLPSQLARGLPTVQNAKA